jgi:hypothetical protein
MTVVTGACNSFWVTVHVFAPSLSPPNIRNPRPRSKILVFVRAVALLTHVQVVLSSNLSLVTVYPH